MSFIWKWVSDGNFAHNGVQEFVCMCPNFLMDLGEIWHRWSPCNSIDQTSSFKAYWLRDAPTV